MKKRRINELFPEPEPEFDAGNNKKYKVKAIIDNVVYAKKTEKHLPGLYYLVSWNNYPEKKSIWEPSFAVIHVQKMISMFQKDQPEKPTATILLLDSALPMAKPSIKPAKPSRKQKQGHKQAQQNKPRNDILGNEVFPSLS